MREVAQQCVQLGCEIALLVFAQASTLAISDGLIQGGIFLQFPDHLCDEPGVVLLFHQDTAACKRFRDGAGVEGHDWEVEDHGLDEGCAEAFVFAHTEE